jgi:hypothetical protein
MRVLKKGEDEMNETQSEIKKTFTNVVNELNKNHPKTPYPELIEITKSIMLLERLDLLNERLFQIDLSLQGISNK